MGGLVYTGSTVGAVLSVFGVCPYCIPALAATASPIAGIPVALTAGVPVVKRLGQRKAIKKVLNLLQEDNTDNTTMIVEDYTSLNEAITSINGVESADVDLETKEVLVKYDPLLTSPEKILSNNVVKAYGGKYNG